MFRGSDPGVLFRRERDSLDGSTILWAAGALICLLTITTYLIAKHSRREFDQLEFLKRISEKDNVQESERRDKPTKDSAG